MMNKIYKVERKRRSYFHFFRLFLVCFVIPISCIVLFACQSQTQPWTERASTPPPKVKQINEQGLRDLLKPKGKPLLINFWATWCGPCREEFPDLVEIGRDHKDKVDLVTVTLDEPSEIESSVPEFLAEMRSDSPAYLLKTPDADAAINLVSQEWQGALPFTILFNAQGQTVYSKQGKFNPTVLTAEIEKLPSSP